MTILRLFVLSLAIGGLGLLALFLVGTCWYVLTDRERKQR